MAIKAPLLLFLLALAAFWTSTHGATPTHYSVPFNRTSFPSGFIFGAGSAAYQVNMSWELVQCYKSLISIRSKKVCTHDTCQHLYVCLVFFFLSPREQHSKMERDLIYGILSPGNSQVFCLSPTLSLRTVLTSNTLNKLNQKQQRLWSIPFWLE